VSMPSQVEVGRSYTTTITLENNESHSVSVTLKEHSSVTGDVSSQPVVVPAKGNIATTTTTHCETPGTRTITYKVFFRDNEVDSWQGTLVAIVPEPLSVDFGGWYVDSSRVNTTTKGKTVIAKIALSGGDPGQYKLRVRRDILWAIDVTVNEYPFSYDGVSATKELSFSPPYATDEASTVGYHLDLLKDGYSVWILTNSYPPRLKVNAS